MELSSSWLYLCGCWKKGELLDPLSLSPSPSTSLPRGPKALHHYSVLLLLVEALATDSLLQLLWGTREQGGSGQTKCHAHILELIYRLCSTVVSLLPSSLELCRQPGVVLYGAEVDEERRRCVLGDNYMYDLMTKICGIACRIELW